MGGLIRAPKPAAAAPEPAPTPAAETPAATPARETSGEAAARLRRGLAGTIATSARGVLESAQLQASVPVARKTLLGE